MPLSDDELEQLFFEIEERAAIMEHDGGLDRYSAERYARRTVVERWSDFETPDAIKRLMQEVDMDAWVRRMRDRQRAAVAAARRRRV